MRRFILCAAAAMVALPAMAASAAIPATGPVLAGAAYIKTTQLPDGTYGTAAPGQNIDAIFAVRASGYDPAKDTVGGKGPVDFLKANAGAATTAAAAAKAALGAKALGLDPKSVGGKDLIAAVTSHYDAAKGLYADDSFSQSVAMLGLACTGNSVPAGASTALKAAQVTADGGWGFGGVSDPDTTAIAVQALLAAGVARADPVVAKALAYLKASQGDDGGFGYDTSESNVSSTAFVVQALLALGENPESAAYTKNGLNPVQYLVSQQNTDGSFKGFDPGYATNQALPALAGRTFCNAPDTAITRTRPVATATPTPSPATVPATATPTGAPATAAPRPPATGNSSGAPGAGAPLVAIFGAALVLGAAGLVAARRRG